MSENPAPFGVLFDMDGTLIDTEPFWQRSEEAIVAQYGKTFTEEEGLDLIGKPIDHAARTIVESKNLPLDPHEFQDRMIQGVLDIEAAEGVPWRPGALALLEALAAEGVPCALVTSSYRRLTMPMLAQAPAGALRAVVVAEDVSRAKPDPEPYRLGAQRLGLAPARCVAIEDSPSGVHAALAAGCRTLGIPVSVPLPAEPGLSFAASMTQIDLPVLARLAAGEVIDLRR